jgi:hypothetical protein
MLTLQSTVSIPAEVLFNRLDDGEAILLNLGTGKYYGLDAVGSRMWALLVQHGQIELAYRALLLEYAVTPEKLQHDLIALVEKLAAQQLLTIHEV